MTNKPGQLLNESISSMIEEIESEPYRAGPYGARVLSALRELQERRKADNAEPVSFDELNAAVAEVTGCNPHAWDASIYKGHQAVPFMNYNSLARIVDKYHAPQPKPIAPSEVIEWLDAEITAIDTMYRGDPSYEHDAYWMKTEVLGVIESARKAFAAVPQPAPVVPDELTREEYKRRFMEEDNFDDTFIGGWNACRTAMLQGADGNSPVIPDDVRRMDWLVSKTVDVREPMVFGSHSLFWSQTITDEEDDYHATKSRDKIDAAMEAEQAAAPQQEVKP